MTFNEWLQTGINNKWCGPAVCATHDGIPSTKNEETTWDNGGDPCQHILRLYPDQQTADEINTTYTPYQWRTTTTEQINLNE